MSALSDQDQAVVSFNDTYTAEYSGTNKLACFANLMNEQDKDEIKAKFKSKAFKCLGILIAYNEGDNTTLTFPSAKGQVVTYVSKDKADKYQDDKNLEAISE